MVDGAVEEWCVCVCLCVSVCVVCESVVSKQPIGKSLKDEDSLQTYYT